MLRAGPRMSEVRMGTPAAFDKARFISLQKNRKFLKDGLSAGIEFDAPGDALLRSAIARDASPERDVELGRVTASVSGGAPAIEFGGDAKGTVSFSGNAGSLSSFGIYLDRDRMLKAIRFDDTQNLRSSLSGLPNDPDGYYGVLRWKYHVAGEAAGSVALGAAGSVKFGGDASREGLFAVVRRFPSATGVMTAAAKTANSWMLPRQVAGFDDLDPETWLLAEVSSGVAFKVTGSLGYNFSWVRRLKSGNLAGDVGLKLQLGLETSVGLSASGRYALVISRESPAQVLRLRLYKLRLRAWDFALNSGAAVETSQALPEDVDDLIKAALGVHGAQIIKDLQAIEKWTDPAKKPSEVLAGLSEEYCKALLEKLAAIPVVGQDIDAFNQARERVLAALNRYGQLDTLAHEAATKILKMIESDGVNLAPVRELAQAIADSDQASFRQLLAGRLEQNDFFMSAEGKWLESALPVGILGALDEACFDGLRKVAGITSQILGGEIPAGVLKRLQDYVNSSLDLEQIKSAVQAADLSHLDAWLKGKLEEFFGKNLDVPALVRLQAALNRLLQFRHEIYSQARKACNKNYQLELHSAYKQTTTDTALCDVEFDFAAPQAARALADALGGEFNEIFLRPPAGVKLHAGVLSHGIKRDCHIEVSLPYFDARTDHITESVAKFSAEESEGRVYVLNAEDKIKDKDRRISTLSIGAYLPLDRNDSVRRHSPQSLAYSYSYQEAAKGLRSAHLHHQLEPWLEAYFKPVFEAKDGSSELWISDLARTLGPGGADQLGNTLISLKLSLPGETTLGWFSAPEDANAPPYLEMSKRLQRAVKRLVPFFYFQDLDNYRDLTPAYALLAFAAIPAMNAVRAEDGRIIETGHGFYWNWLDVDLRRQVVSSALTRQNLMMTLNRISKMLDSVGRDSEAYLPGAAVLDNILASVSAVQGSRLLSGLLKFEADAVHGAVRAGTSLAKFRAAAEKDATKALDALSDFGAAAAETFNSELSGVYGGGPSRPLSTMLFIEAAAALDARVRPGSRAMLDLVFLADAAPFPDGYLGGADPRRKDIRLAQSLLNPL